MEINANQTVFMVFYAIFWSSIANVQPRWKAFQWPLFCSVRVARNRVLLSFFVLNVFPLIFFGYVFWALAGNSASMQCESLYMAIQVVIRGVIPAFAAFGFYRLWLGIVEINRDCFYVSRLSQLPEKYWNIEPTYRTKFESCCGNCYRPSDAPIVDLGEDTGCKNILCALAYIVVAALAPCLCFWSD